MIKCWNWTENPETHERVLELSGIIASESWFDDEVTPKMFKDELMSGEGDITVWINSPGGDCFAAAQIYNMLSEYKGNVKVIIDGIAASAASVIAMAGTKVVISKVGMIMIHNPMTSVFGDHFEMDKAKDRLDSVKESIMNAYEHKTKLSRTKLSHMMDDETWMDAGKALELGFVDEILSRDGSDYTPKNQLFSRAQVVNSLMDKIKDKCETKENEPTGRSVEELMDRLFLLKR